MVAISIIRVCLAVYEWVALLADQFHGFCYQVEYRCLRKSKAHNQSRTMTKVKPNSPDRNKPKKKIHPEEEVGRSQEIKQIVLRMIATVFLLVLMGTAFYASVEEMTLVDACYMSTATVATVGYGDIAPVTRSGRTFAVCWIILSYGMIARSLHLVIDKFHEMSLETRRLKVLNRDWSRANSLNMDKNGDGELSRMEFLSHMVVKLKLCTEMQLDKIMDRFDEIEESRIARDRVMTIINNRNATQAEMPATGHKLQFGEEVVESPRGTQTVISETQASFDFVNQKIIPLNKKL